MFCKHEQQSQFILAQVYINFSHGGNWNVCWCVCLGGEHVTLMGLVALSSVISVNSIQQFPGQGTLES